MTRSAANLAERNARGSSKDRAARRAWLVTPAAGWGGNGQMAPCALGLPVCQGWVTVATMHVDRIICGADGGRYVRSNIRPTCAPCNQSRSNRW